MEKVLLSAIILLIARSVSVWGKQRCCHHVGCFTNDYPFNAFPLPKCEDVIQVGMQLYTRDNPKEGEVMTWTTIPPSYKQGKRVLFLTHGYMNWMEIYWLQDHKDALLKQFDYNVVIVGWAGGSMDIDYTQAASNTRVVGAEIALTAKNLVEQGGAVRSQLWCIGHSLGSHVCGHAGQKYKFGKITGLDPAGPWFEDKDWSIGINPSTADFVDIWHTNGDTDLLMAFGTLKRLGHVDFYPNGGGFQPGCVLDPHRNSSLEYLSQKFVDPMPACSHMRSVDLFEEAIASQCQMYATHFCNDESNIPLSCFACDGGRCGVMGMDSHLWDYDKLTSLQYMKTNGGKPFCRNIEQLLD